MSFEQLFEKVCAKNNWSQSGDGAELVLPGGRKQRVLIQRFQHGSDDMARAYSVVGGAEEMSATRLTSALSLNFNLPYGALAIHGGKLVMTDTFLIRDADEGEVEASIRFLAETADRYEKQIYHTDEN